MRWMSVWLVLLLAPLARAGAGAADAMEACRKYIRAAQLEDGAIRMSARGDTVLIRPYYGNVAAKALLLSADKAPDADVELVRRWLAWCASHLESDGTLRDYVGTTGHYAASEKRIAIDTYAPSLLGLIRVYRERGAKESEAAGLLELARKALAGTESTIDPSDGLAWSSVPHRTKYPMDNLDVCLGLGAGAEFFKKVHADREAAKAAELCEGCKRGVASLWLGERHYFAWAKGASGALSSPFEKPYPDGVVNLYACGIIEPARADLYGKLSEKFGQEARLRPEMWLVAARRVGAGEDVQRWEVKTIQEAEKIDSIERASRMLMALGAGEAGEVSLQLGNP